MEPDKHERINSILLDQIDAIKARAEAAEVVARQRTIVALALFARLEERGTVVVTKTQLEQAGAMNVEMQDANGDLVLLDPAVVQAHLETQMAGSDG